MPVLILISLDAFRLHATEALAMNKLNITRCYTRFWNWGLGRAQHLSLHFLTTTAFNNFQTLKNNPFQSSQDAVLCSLIQAYVGFIDMISRMYQTKTQNMERLLSFSHIQKRKLMGYFQIGEQRNQDAGNKFIYYMYD